MSKVVTPINKRCQGNSDPSSNWAKARYRWITQLLIRLGMPPDDLSDFMKDGTLEECFSQDVLSSHKLDIKCIGWWDEVHKSCHIGDKREGATDHVQVRFVTPERVCRRMKPDDSVPLLSQPFFEEIIQICLGDR